MTPLTLGNRKNRREPDLVSRMVASTPQCYFLQELPGCFRRCEPEHCHDEAAITSSPTILLSGTKPIKRRKISLYTGWLMVWCGENSVSTIS